MNESEATGLDLSPIANLLFQGIDMNDASEIGNAFRAVFFLYLIVLTLSVITYKLGFAKQLPVLKSAVIYVVLAVGCIVLTFLAINLPIAEGLVVSSLVLGIYRFRLHKERGEKES